MIAQKYGTVPIVRTIGGLAETVFDRDYSDRPPQERTGYVFHQLDECGVESALDPSQVVAAGRLREGDRDAGHSGTDRWVAEYLWRRVTD